MYSIKRFIENESGRLLAVFLAVGIILRIFVAFAGGTAPHYEYPVGMDEVNYLELASNTMEFKTYGAWSESFFTRSTRSPVYPAILASTRLFTENTPLAGHILNLLLDIMNIFLVWRLALILYGRTAAFFAGAGYAVFGPAMFYMHFITSDTLSVFLFLFLCISIALAKYSYLKSVLLTVPASALMIHTKPAFLLVIPFVCLAYYLYLKGFAPFIRRLAASILPGVIVLLLCIPWTLRNYSIHKSFVPVCTVAGWHLYDTVLDLKDLSPEPLMNFIYSPERSSYTETDYYNEGMACVHEKFLKNPFKSPFYGFIRLLGFWLPQEPYIRIFLPYAYLMPLWMNGSFFIPLPDFEGVIYVFSILLMISFFLHGRSLFRKEIGAWFAGSREIITITFAYLISYSFGFPMIQYRFVAEPVLIVLGAGLISSFFFPSAIDKTAGRLFNILYPILIIFIVIISFTISFGVKSNSFPYPNKEPDGVWDFASLHKFQRLNLGNLPADAKIAESGVVKYLKNSLEFRADKNFAEKCEGSTVAKLYVGLYDPRAPMGTGDLKLNFPGGAVPGNGDKIIVRGCTGKGLYKDIIVDVENWESLEK